ncbi:MAG: response regulator transcription factor [Anaerolineae bacterium]|nr:response regulator transcription factor [Anaerolineae bacterium]
MSSIDLLKGQDDKGIVGSRRHMVINIVIADDSDLMIVGIQAILESDANCFVVGSGQALNEILKPIELYAPEIAIIGECLYDTDILNTIDTLRAKSQTIAILVMGMMTDGALIHNLFLHGVKAYLYRSDPLRDCLLLAIRTVLKNRPYLSPTADAEYLIALQSGQTLAPLSSEGRAVLNYLTQGNFSQSNRSSDGDYSTKSLFDKGSPQTPFRC